jgi:hypothetical protein
LDQEFQPADGSFDPNAAPPAAPDETPLPFPVGDERNAPYLPAPDAAAEESPEAEPPQPEQPQAPQPQQAQPDQEKEWLRAQLQQREQERQHEMALRAQQAWQAEQAQMAQFVRNRDAALAAGTLDPQEAVRLTEQLAQRQIQQRDQALNQYHQTQQARQFQEQLMGQINFERQALQVWTDQIATRHGLDPQERQLLLGAHPDAMDALAARLAGSRHVQQRQQTTQQFQQRQQSHVDRVGGAGGRAGDPRLRPGSRNYDSDAHLAALLDGML